MLLEHDATFSFTPHAHAMITLKAPQKGSWEPGFSCHWDYSSVSLCLTLHPPGPERQSSGVESSRGGDAIGYEAKLALE